MDSIPDLHRDADTGVDYSVRNTGVDQGLDGGFAPLDIRTSLTDHHKRHPGKWGVVLGLSASAALSWAVYANTGVLTGALLAVRWCWCHLSGW